MAVATGMTSLPSLPPNTCRVEEYAVARRQNWVAQSTRGLEVLRYRQGTAVLQHPKLEKGPAFLRRLDDFGLTSGPAREYWEKTLITNEGEVRRRLRVPLAELFRASQIATLQKTIRGLVDEALDAIIDHSNVDFMREIAWTLPPQVYCHLISAPRELAAKFAHLSDAILAPILTCDRTRLEEFVDALWQGYAFVEEHLEARRKDLGNDFTSLMIRQQMAGLITQEELVLEAMGLLQASIDNTVHQLGLTFGTLLEDRSHWEQLVAQPNLVASAVEETFRLRPRFGTIFRYAREPVPFEDIMIRAIHGCSFRHVRPVATRLCLMTRTLFDLDVDRAGH